MRLDRRTIIPRVIIDWPADAAYLYINLTYPELFASYTQLHPNTPASHTYLTYLTYLIHFADFIRR